MEKALQRKRLHQYIDEAGSDKIEALFTLLQNDLTVEYSNEMIQELDKRRANHLDGKDGSYSIEESFAAIRDSVK